MIQSGIRTVYYAEDYHNHPYAIDLFKEAGVTTRKVEVDESAADASAPEKKQLVETLLKKLEHAPEDEKNISELRSEAEKLFKI